MSGTEESPIDPRRVSILFIRPSSAATYTRYDKYHFNLTTLWWEFKDIDFLWYKKASSQIQKVFTFAWGTTVVAFDDSVLAFGITLTNLNCSEQIEFSSNLRSSAIVGYLSSLQLIHQLIHWIFSEQPTLCILILLQQFSKLGDFIRQSIGNSMILYKRLKNEPIELLFRSLWLSIVLSNDLKHISTASVGISTLLSDRIRKVWKGISIQSDLNLTNILAVKNASWELLKGRINVDVNLNRGQLIKQLRTRLLTSSTSSSGLVFSGLTNLALGSSAGRSALS